MQPKWGVVALAALTLAACGGGGGGGGSVPAGVATTGTTAPVQVSLGAAAGLSYADFGYWNTPTGPANYYVSGMQTPATQLPPTGANITATYNGTYAETHTAYLTVGPPPGGGPQVLIQNPAGSGTGGIQINADFGARTVEVLPTSGLLSAVQFVPAIGSIANTGTYSALSFDPSPIGYVNITFNGAFYGPSTPSQAPRETAGTFNGTFGEAGSGSIVGSFGAHR
jgi:hypothetical protein